MKPFFSFLISMTFVSFVTAASHIDSTDAGFLLKYPKLESLNKYKTQVSDLDFLDKNLIINKSTFEAEPQLNLFGKCTIKVHTELDNGVVIEGTVVIEGIPWYECIGIKIYDLFSSTF